MASFEIYEDPLEDGIDSRLVTPPDGPLIPALEAQYDADATSQGIWCPKNKKRKLHRLSKLAKVYGVNNIRLVWPEKDGHTGLTPLPLDEQSGDFDRDNLVSYTKQQAQRELTNGWTSKEMVALDALAPYHVTPARLPNDPNWRPRTLHPLVERSRWRTEGDLGAGEAFLPVGSGIGGVYNAANDDVWNMLLPALCAVSNMFDAAENSQWLNALLDPKQYTAENASGFYTSEEAGCTPWRQPWRATFWSKSGPVDPEDKKRIRRRLEDLSRHIKVQINNCDVENTQSRILKKSIVEWSTMANTGYFVRPGPAQEGQAELQSLITINYKLLHHMLSGGLNKSKIEGTQALLAETLTHELVHALWQAMTIDGERPERHPHSGEPFYEKEAIHELGWSMMHNVFGVFIPYGPCPPVLGSFTRNWPTQIDGLAGPMKPEERQKIKDRTSRLPEQTQIYYFPIPCSYNSLILSGGFWAQRNAQGGRISHKKSTIYGRGRYQYYNGIDEKFHEIDFLDTEMSAWDRHPDSAFFRNRYQFSTNEYQKLKAAYYAECKVGLSRSLETYAKQRLDNLESNQARINGIDDVRQLKEKERLAGPGNYADFEWKIQPVREQPESFNYIDRAVLKLRKRCCFESMLKPRPAYLVLDYLNRAIRQVQAEGDKKFHREVDQEEWFDFLEFVSSQRQFYHDHRYLSHRNNAPRGNGIEWMKSIPAEWDEVNCIVYPPAVDYSNQPLLEDGECGALRDFKTFMEVFSGFRDRRDGLMLARWALGIWFLWPGEEFDLDAVTFNRCYNGYLERENARMKKTARHKWSGPPLCLPMELMMWAFGSGKIKGWVLGPFETLRYTAPGKCVFSLTSGENKYYEMAGNSVENMDRLNGDKYVKQLKEEDARAKHKHFIKNSWAPLKRSLQRREGNEEDAGSQDVQDFRDKWEEMRRAGRSLKDCAQSLPKKQAGLQILHQKETLATQLGRRWLEEEQARKTQREALRKEFADLMQSHWYWARGTHLQGTQDGMEALYGLWQKVLDAIGDHGGKMDVDQQRTLAYDKQNHIVWLEDLNIMLQGMIQWQVMRRWGDPLPDAVVRPSQRREELWTLQATHEDDFRNSPQWFFTQEQKAMWWKLIVERQKSQPVLMDLDESEQAKWEKEKTVECRKAKRKRDEVKEKAANKRGKYNPPPHNPSLPRKDMPFTMMDVSSRQQSGGAMPTRPDHTYSTGRNRQAKRK